MQPDAIFALCVDGLCVDGRNLEIRIAPAHQPITRSHIARATMCVQPPNPLAPQIYWPQWGYFWIEWGHVGSCPMHSRNALAQA